MKIQDKPSIVPTGLTEVKKAPIRYVWQLGVFLVFVVISFGAWALASPVGATPDEDFHLASIWCGSGERDGLCAAGSSDENRSIPDKINKSICYAHDAEQSADCQGTHFQDTGFGLVDSSRVNTGQYPSGYYFWSSLVITDNLAVSTLVLRILQGLFFTVLAMALWALLPRKNRVAFIGAIAITFVPIGMFLIPSVNPSGWAIASSALLFPALVGYLTTTGWRSVALGAFTVVAALLGLGSRGDSAAYSIVAVLAGLVVTYQPTSVYFKRAVLPFGIIFASVVTFLNAGQTGLALEGMTQTGFESFTRLGLLFENVLALPDLYAGVLGQNFDGSEFAGLGWLDTPLPAMVWAPTTFVFAGVIFASFHRMELRRILALFGVGAAAVVIPLYILTQSHVPVGYQVQPRYVMPLLVLFAAVALTPSIGGRILTSRLPKFTNVQYWIIVVLLSGANATALFTHMRRYVAPGDFNLINYGWWWQFGPSPMTVWIVGSISFAVVAALLARTVLRSPTEVEQ